MLDLMGELRSIPSSPQASAGQGGGQVANLDFDRLLLAAREERQSAVPERREAEQREMDDRVTDEVEEQAAAARDQERVDDSVQKAGKEVENDAKAAENFEPLAYLGEVMQEISGLAPVVEVPVE